MSGKMFSVVEYRELEDGSMHQVMLTRFDGLDEARARLEEAVRQWNVVGLSGGAYLAYGEDFKPL